MFKCKFKLGRVLAVHFYYYYSTTTTKKKKIPNIYTGADSVTYNSARDNKVSKKNSKSGQNKKKEPISGQRREEDTLFFHNNVLGLAVTMISGSQRKHRSLISGQSKEKNTPPSLYSGRLLHSNNIETGPVLFTAIFS